jgi:hypothetical protein
MEAHVGLSSGRSRRGEVAGRKRGRLAGQVSTLPHHLLTLVCLHRNHQGYGSRSMIQESFVPGSSVEVDTEASYSGCVGVSSDGVESSNHF